MQTMLMPYLIVDGAEAAIKYYEKLFDANTKGVVKNDSGTKVLNAMLIMHDGPMFMVQDPFPEFAPYYNSPKHFGGASVTTHVQVGSKDRVDEIFARLDERATVMMKPDIQFWGDYYCQFIDPFGQPWSVGFSPNA